MHLFSHSARFASSLAICAVALGGLATAPAARADVVYLITGQSNANNPVSVDEPRSWALNELSAFDFGGGDFVMKTNAATEDAVLSLYLGTSNAGTLLTFLAQAPGAFTPSYTHVAFHFDDVQNLLAATDYFVELTSLTATGGNTDYKIKGDLGTFSLVPADQIEAGLPEPLSLAIFASGLAGLGIVRRRRAARS
ncbi:MAG: hypothetical protein EXR07_14600 [Acetobacteraceae bacterium]|nr:hypothetical protein [Acetobacteraceae bacterium]